MISSRKSWFIKKDCSVAPSPSRIKIQPAGHLFIQQRNVFLQPWSKHLSYNHAWNSMSRVLFDLFKFWKFPFLRSHTEEVCTSGLQFFISIRKLLLWRFPISLKPIGLKIILPIRFRTSFRMTHWNKAIKSNHFSF